MHFFFLYNYTVIMIFLFISFFISLMLVGTSFLLSKKIKNKKKQLAYECGFNSYSSARLMFDVHFFIVALLFLVFDIELVFLYPWSVSFTYLNFYGIESMYIFLMIIIVGYIYEWQKGALNWTFKY